MKLIILTEPETGRHLVLSHFEPEKPLCFELIAVFAHKEDAERFLKPERKEELLTMAQVRATERFETPPTHDNGATRVAAAAAAVHAAMVKADAAARVPGAALRAAIGVAEPPVGPRTLADEIVDAMPGLLEATGRKVSVKEIGDRLSIEATYVKKAMKGPIADGRIVPVSSGNGRLTYYFLAGDVSLPSLLSPMQSKAIDTMKRMMAPDGRIRIYKRQFAEEIGSSESGVMAILHALVRKRVVTEEAAGKGNTIPTIYRFA